MTTVSGTLTEDSVSSTLVLGNQPENVTYSFSGTINGDLTIQRRLGTSAWETVLGPVSTAGASGTYLARPGDQLRVSIQGSTTPSVTYSIADEDAVIRVFRDNDGDPTMTETESAFTFHKPVVVEGAVTAEAAVGGDGSVGFTGQAAASATAAGGAVAHVGADGGSTSGTGGAVSQTAGAGTAGSAAGGAAVSDAGAGAPGATTVAGGVGGEARVKAGAGGAKTGTGAAAGGAGGTAKVVGGAGGATASSGTDAGGRGGTVEVTAGDGGAASAGTGNGGSAGHVKLTPGAGGTSAGGTAGKEGRVLARGVIVRSQAVPAAKTVTAAISAAELVAGLVTTTGATGPSEHQLPTGTLIDAEIPDVATGDSFDFHVINTGVGASDDATLTVNTDVTIVGNPTVGALTDATIISGSGHFRARRSAANTWVVYRLA